MLCLKQSHLPQQKGLHQSGPVHVTARVDAWKTVGCRCIMVLLMVIIVVIIVIIGLKLAGVGGKSKPIRLPSLVVCGFWPPNDMCCTDMFLCALCTHGECLCRPHPLHRHRLGGGCLVTLQQPLDE